MRPRTPRKYVVFNRAQLYKILTRNKKLSTMDNLKVGIMADLINDGLSLYDIWHLFDKYGIDYYTRRAVIDMKLSMNQRKELPEEISFVTCWAREDFCTWENNFSKKHW